MKTKKSSDALRALNKAIDEAGELQKAKRAAINAYNDKREEVEKLLRETVGEEILAQAKSYEAIISYDEVNCIEVNTFLEKVEDPLIRRLCMTVVLKSATAVIGKVSPGLFRDLVHKKKKEVPTLHIEMKGTLG